jgi:hypothetical protein
MRYLLQPSETPNYFICTDTINKIVCKFEAHNFNDNQEFTLLEDCTVSPNMLATLAKDMGDWLRENHPDKLF